MKQIIPIAIIIVALVVLAWYYAGDRSAVNQAQHQASESDAQVEQRTLQDEGGVVANENPDKATIEATIVGTWQAVDDEKSVAMFNADGTTRDIYDGAELSTGNWSVVTMDVGDITGATVLQTTIGDNTYEYMVWQVNETQLVLNYTARGNTLVYTRIE